MSHAQFINNTITQKQYILTAIASKNFGSLNTNLSPQLVHRPPIFIKILKMLRKSLGLEKVIFNCKKTF